MFLNYDAALQLSATYPVIVTAFVLIVDRADGRTLHLEKPRLGQLERAGQMRRLPAVILALLAGACLPPKQPARRCMT
jgi:hypothetical protein